SSGLEAQLLGCQVLSRLFLAGYQLPAQAAETPLDSIPEFIRQGLLVLVQVAQADWPASVDFDDIRAGRRELLLATHSLEGQVKFRGLFADGEPSLGLSLIKDGRPSQTIAYPAVIAARTWQELANRAGRFFGGERYADGAYHWHSAEYETDGHGAILRIN